MKPVFPYGRELRLHGFEPSCNAPKNESRQELTESFFYGHGCNKCPTSPKSGGQIDAAVGRLPSSTKAQKAQLQATCTLIDGMLGIKSSLKYISDAKLA